MKKKVFAICLMLIPMMLSLMIAGCIDLPPVKDVFDEFKETNYEQTDLFVYKKTTNMMGEPVIQIMNITEAARNMEYLVVPDEIDGLPVEILSQCKYSYCAKKIYISKNVKKIINGSFISSIDKSYDTKYIYLSNECTSESVIPNRYKYVSSYSKNNYLSNINNALVVEANLNYYWNYAYSSNGGVYFVDDLDVGEKIAIIPDDPIREGYTFTGWYTEEDCTNLFNINSFVLPKDDTIISLYAGWIKQKNGG